jgi:hypothetical protein
MEPLLARVFWIVFHLEIPAYLVLMVSVLALEAISWISHGDDVWCNVGKIKVKALVS